jgi:hypothetical protein
MSEYSGSATFGPVIQFCTKYSSAHKLLICCPESAWSLQHVNKTVFFIDVDKIQEC